MTENKITFDEVVLYAKRKFPQREGKTRTKDRTQTYVRNPYSMRPMMVLYEGERKHLGAATWQTTWICIDSGGNVCCVPTCYLSKYDQLLGFSFTKNGWEKINEFLEEIRNG